MRIIKCVVLLGLVVLFSGCALISKQNIRQGNSRTLRYGLIGGWIPLYSSTEVVESPHQ